MSADLVAFLRARLDDDEMTATATLDSARGWHLRILPGGYPQRVMANGNAALVCETYDGPIDDTGIRRSPTSGQHIARFDPVRICADVAAKRAIVDLHQPYKWTSRHTGRRFVECDKCSESREEYAQDGHEDWPCATLRHLAAVYAGHADYDERWKP